MDYKLIPQVNTLLECAAFKPLVAQYGWTLSRNCLREVLDTKRLSIASLTPADLLPSILANETLLGIASSTRCSYRRVFNATGTVLHTNLGRAPMPPEALNAVAEASQGYCNLEMNLKTGQRGHRTDEISATVKLLTGAEAAIAVNNNAGAVLLALTAIAKGREVVVSRGELIEIGGGFRIPEVIESGGAILREVGTTNRTHFQDYERAISDRTAVIMKASTSNYAIVGFTSEVPIEDLIKLGQNHSIPVMYDLGSGNFFDGDAFGWHSPLVADVIANGIDIVTFSGDKLLGGPQAGIIAGRKKWIDRIASNPLTRALRLDKMTLAALDATLKLYLQPEQVIERIPVLKALCTQAPELSRRAEVLAKALEQNLADSWEISVQKDIAAVGGGSLPMTQLETWVVAIQSSSVSPIAIAEMLRGSDPPVIGRIQKDTLLLDLRTIPEEDLDSLIESVIRVLS